MTSTPSTISASVTRILSLTGFPKELKTKDIQTAFADFENANGGFKIKWIDDTSLYIVFQDPTVAKRAYLRTLASPPANFTSESTGESATIRPYDGPDAQTVIQAVNARQNGGAGSRRAASISVPAAPRGGLASGRGHASHASFSVAAANANGREPSPTLPSIPSHPTLDALIGASLSTAASTPPRIGDPGKRMVGHALGVRHPGLSPKVNGTTPPMGGLTVAE